MNVIPEVRDAPEASDVLLTGPGVRLRYGGKSNVWLWRVLRDDPHFPRPMKIRHQRYWRLSELMAYENARRVPNASAA
jgi:predicted DNA-binding transcriptional regulator AlpA